MQISILVKIIEISRFRSKFSKTSILSKFSNHLDFGQIREKTQFMSNFRKIRILVKIFRKIAIVVKIFENLDFGEDFWIASILDKFF